MNFCIPFTYDTPSCAVECDACEILLFSHAPCQIGLGLIGFNHETSNAQFRRCSIPVPNLTEELSTAKERGLNQFVTAVLIDHFRGPLSRSFKASLSAKLLLW